MRTTLIKPILLVSGDTCYRENQTGLTVILQKVLILLVFWDIFEQYNTQNQTVLTVILQKVSILPVFWDIFEQYNTQNQTVLTAILLKV